MGEMAERCKSLFKLAAVNEPLPNAMHFDGIGFNFIVVGFCLFS